MGFDFTKLDTNLLLKSGLETKTNITAPISIKTSNENIINFGFQTILAKTPPHALIRKLVLSPVKADTTIDNKTK